MFAIVFLLCILDVLNVPYIGEIFDLIPCGVSFWCIMLSSAAIIDLSGREEYSDMKHSAILANFLRQHPEHTYDISKWAPVGENSIYITFENGTEMVFTYNGGNNWTLTSVGDGRKRGLLHGLFFK